MQSISRIGVPTVRPWWVLAVLGVLCAWIAWSSVVRRVEPGAAGVVVDYGAGTSSGRPSIRSLPTGQR